MAKKKTTTSRKSEAEPESPWRSRIVGHDRVDPASLAAHPLNFRVHPQAQREGLRAVIDEIGFLRSVTVNRRSGLIVDGHERVAQALAAGQPLIEVEYVDLDEAEEQKALATFDAIGALAGRDDEIVRALVGQIDTDSVPLLVLLEQISPSEHSASAGTAVGAEPAAADHAGIPDLELQPYEHYDYVLILARTTHQWHQLVELLEIKPRVDSSTVATASMKKVGLGRAVDATRILAILEKT